jgi:hypothetical protein
LQCKIKTSNNNLNIQTKMTTTDKNNVTNTTYNVVFNDDNNSNDKGFEQTLEYCKNYIQSFNGTNHSYFEDYKGGIVQVVCNETGDVVYEEEVI